MAEYIERDAAKRAIMSQYLSRANKIKYADVIDAVPAADVVPVVHGRWILNRNLICVGDDFGHWICSECAHEAVFGDKQFDLKRYNYCPNCGARMDGDRE